MSKKHLVGENGYCADANGHGWHYLYLKGSMSAFFRLDDFTEFTIIRFCLTRSRQYTMPMTPLVETCDDWHKSDLADIKVSNVFGYDSREGGLRYRWRSYEVPIYSSSRRKMIQNPGDTVR